MFRLSGIMMICFAVILGVMLFHTSQSVQKAEKKLALISQNSSGEEEALRALSTEWDYLNRPQRLESLASKNLDLDKDITKQQNLVEGVADIPKPMAPVIPKAKPEFLNHVSTQKIKEQKEKTKAPVIQKTEKEKFERLLKNFQEDAP
jgi:hypothetical protein